MPLLKTFLGFLFIKLTSCASASATAKCIIIGMCRRTSESGNGESNSSEQIARTIIACDAAFLIRNTVIGSLDKKLCGSYDSYDRENSKRNVYCGTFHRCTKLAVKNSVYCVGELKALTAAATYALFYLCAEYNWLYCLYNGCRTVISNCIKIAYVAVAILRT